VLTCALCLWSTKRSNFYARGDLCYRIAPPFHIILEGDYYMKQIYIAPTYKCNNRCIMCGVFNTKKDSEWKYSLEELKTEIDSREIATGDVVIVSGGEPTIYPYFFDMLKYLELKDARVTIFSNGRAFKSNDNVSKLKECKYENMLIPLFGSNAQTHDRLTGAKGSFDDTIKGLHNLELNGLTHSIKTVVMKDNYANLPDWACFVSENFKHPHMVSIHGLHLQGEAHNVSEELYVRHDEIANYVEKALDSLLSNEYKVGISAFPLCTIDPYYWKYNIVSDIKNYKAISKDSKEISETNRNNYELMPTQCESCRVKELCQWPWRMYKKMFTLDYIKPI